ncbi:hypothetical protein TRVA0_001S06568 [Trichomonascus vanleenenianus]|uniref:putative protein kinase ISR1 n=1 Tax=Trichomonascus vanleenenianus TaxID=2268995 RepID=UPI003ECB0813
MSTNSRPKLSLSKSSTSIRTSARPPLQRFQSHVQHPTYKSSGTATPDGVSAANSNSGGLLQYPYKVTVTGRVVGRGSFCTVQEAQNERGGVLAVKLPSRKNVRDVIKREARILSYVFANPGTSAPGIAVFHGIITVDGSELGLVLNYYPKTVKSFIQSTPSVYNSHDVYTGKRLWVSWAIQLCHGLRFLQQKGVVHGDIKSDNIFLDSMLNPFIGDFSSARRIRYSQSAKRYVYDDDTPGLKQESAFSIQYSAPELLSDKANRPTFASDLFSLGLVLFHAASGSEPYSAATKNIAQKLIWARKGAVLTYCSDEEMTRIRDIQHLLGLFLIKREPLQVILPALTDFASTIQQRRSRN